MTASNGNVIPCGPSAFDSNPQSANNEPRRSPLARLCCRRRDRGRACRGAHHHRVETALRFGQTLTLTAIVSPATSGTVTFYDGVSVVAIEPVSSGTAIAKTSALAAGPHTVFARYQASSQYAASVSSKISITVTTLPATAFDPLPAFGSNISNTVLVADLNNDQTPDLIVTNVGPSNSAVWLGNGDGTFRPSSQPSLEAAVVLIADFNNDGKPDLLAETSTNGIPTPQIFFGAGDGTFTAFGTLPPRQRRRSNRRRAGLRSH